VGVGVEGEADLAVAEELHDDSGGDAGGQEVGGGAVAEVMGTVGARETGLSEELLELVVDVAVVERGADGTGEDEIEILPGGAGGEAELGDAGVLLAE
jgi:hypothetical protein